MKAVNTPENVFKEQNNGDKEYVERLHGKHGGSVMELDPKHQIQWCPGCGNFGILLAIKKAIVKLELAPEDVVIVSGIGCSGKLPHYIKTYGVETLHGRALPVATGVKLANKDLNVIVVGGDGDGYGVGMGHFIHSMRRNINITYIVHDNEIYGLTKGQTSPTSPKGTKSSSTPNGSIETAVNPIELALAGGATYIARGFSGDMEGLSEMIANGIAHKGFSLIDVAQPCVSYNPKKSFEYYQERVFRIETLSSYDSKSKIWAHAMTNMHHEDKIPMGVFYHSDSDRGTYIDELPEDKELALVRQDISNIDVEKLISNYE